MKRLLKLVLLIAIFVIDPLKIYADPIEYIIGLVDPEIGVKRVEFLPSGHLHKNKPRYENCKWVINETSFFKIATCGLDEDLVNFLIEEADKVSDEFSARTHFKKFNKKIEIAIHSSARHFQETNLIFGLVPEGLGGSTEIVKRKRVLIAFRDSVKGFQRLLRHELAHRYDVEIMNLKLINLATRSLPPLWFVEGAAQQMAHSLDSRSALIMRDAYINDYLAHADGPWHPILIYTQGEYTLHYLAERHKEKGDVITDIFRECSRTSFPEAFRKVTGETLKEFDEALHRHIEKEYFQIRSLDDITDKAKTIDKGIVLAAKKQFFVTKKDAFGRHALYLNWTDGHELKSKKLTDSVRLNKVRIRGLPLELSPEFGFQEHGASFPSSTTVLYAIDKGGKDVIVEQKFSFIEKKRRIKLYEKKVYEIESVRDIQYPVMIDNEKIAFVGRKKIFAEIYTLNTKTNQVRQLTSNRRTYRGLVYSKKYQLLITSIENEATDSYDLAAYDLKSRKMYLLTESPENEFSVTISSNGSALLYTSDKGLVHNIYHYDLDSRTALQLTNVRVGVFRPHWFGKNGMIFNAFNRGELLIKSAPIAIRNSSGTIQKVKTANLSKPNNSETDKFQSLLSNADKINIFETIISSDRTKALILENRVLSMEMLGRKDPEIRFHLVNSSTTKVKTFMLKKFSRIKNFGSAVILANSQLLLQRSESYRDKTEYTDYNGDTTYVEEEKIFEETFLYDPYSEELVKLDYEVFGEDDSKILKISPNRSLLLWVDEDVITIYDILKRKEIGKFKGFSEIKDAEFISDTEIAALEKKWGLRLHYLILKSTTSQIWDITTRKEQPNIEDISWQAVPKKKKIFFLTIQKNKEQRYKVGIFDLRLGTMTVIYPQISAILGKEMENETLVLKSKDLYGLEKTISIDTEGKITTKTDSVAYNIQNTSAAISGYKQVTPRELKAKKHIMKRLRNLSKFPRPYYGYGAGGVGLGDGRLLWYLALNTLFLDELNDKMLWGDVYMQGNYGVARVTYYNLPQGLTYSLDYWNYDGKRQDLAIDISKNIFLHEFINWDATLREEYVRTDYYGINQDTWRTKVGTTFSIDTTISDWHGPHSGTAIFSEIEAGLDEHSRYQGIDLNLDARHYLPITERSGLAFRLAGGKATGPNPTLFVWGGNKTFRGTTFDGQAGNTYLLHSSELRIPLLDGAGAKISGPIGDAFQFLTIYMDIRGGMYYDTGDIWYEMDPPPGGSGHKGYQNQKSAGAFVNIPTILGINVRFSQEIWWGRQFNFWLGYNW